MTLARVVASTSASWQASASRSESSATIRTGRGIRRTADDTELKCGQLLKEREKAKGGGDVRKPKDHRSSRTTSAPKTLADMGISKDQSSRFQRLAENPKAFRSGSRHRIMGGGHSPRTHQICTWSTRAAAAIIPSWIPTKPLDHRTARTDAGAAGAEAVHPGSSIS